MTIHIVSAIYSQISPQCCDRDTSTMWRANNECSVWKTNGEIQICN